MNFDEKEPSETTEPQGAVNEFGDELDPSFVSGAPAKSNKGMLSALGLVLACGGAMCFWYFHHGPQTAVAAGAPDAAASTTINAFLNGDAGNVKLMDQTLRETDKVVQEFRGYPGKTQVPVDALKTNPFRLADVIAKTIAAPDPDEGASLRRREEERAAARKAVQSLQLQSVLRAGTRKACMINNTLYKEGDEAEGFVVEQIGPSLVVVRKGVYRFELHMNK